MAGRRTDTRQRIQQVALELFAERGYEQTTLQEVAERLEITRPALYYHFKAKEDILNGVIEDLNASLDELMEWARAQPHTAEAKRGILDRIADLLEDRWRPLFRFAQVNQTAMERIPAGEGMQERLITLLSVLTTPGADPVRQFEERLAVFALILGTLPFLFEMELPEDQRTATAMTVAARLVSGQ